MRQQFLLLRRAYSYTDNRGLSDLRREIFNYVETNFNVDYNPEDEVLVTVGVSEAVDLALRALLNPETRCFYHQPCYVSYHPSAILAHGQPIAVPTQSDEGFASTSLLLQKHGSLDARF